jgi:hypothetical protein
MFIDPKTGEAREPTPQELAEISKRQAASRQQASEGAASRPKAVQLPDGTIMVPMDGQPQTPVQACVAKDGTLTIDHDCQDAAKRSQEDQQ